MRAFVFYPAVLTLAGLAILASLGPAAFPERPTAQAGRREGGDLVFDPEALFHVDEGGTQVLHRVRERGVGRALAVQIATRRDAGAPDPALPGAQLRLDPAAMAPFAGEPLEVVVKVRPLPYTTAERLALSAAAGASGREGARVQWVAAALPSESASLSFVLPALEGGPPGAIGFWPASAPSDYDYGVEIVEVRLRAASLRGVTQTAP